MEDKEWVLKNVEEICANTKNIDEVCMTLEQSTIFTIEMIQTLTTNLLKIDLENKQLKDKLKKIEEYINKNNVYKYNEKGICIESPYIDWQYISRDMLKIIKGDD